MDFFLISIKCLYIPSCFINSSWFPSSAIRPLSITIILSASLTVDNLWAIVIRVLFFVNYLIDLISKCSFSGSTLEVASSKIMIGASFKIALAMDILCFSPPDKVEPPSPTTVL